MEDGQPEREIPTFCALCVSRCGATATVRDGRLVSLRPDPWHPTGQALCVKGKAAPEIVHHPDRLLYPLKRTRPKGDPDPGWERITWDEALATAADRLLGLARDHGPESVVFSSASPSTSAMSDSIDWVQRLRRAFGSPSFVVSMELCGWGRYLASTYTWGAAVPGAYMPDIENAGCILYWGYNPSVARLAHATATVAAHGRGARLIVVDPRRAGLARRADEWLRVRPGTDAVLALALAHVMIDRGWFDREFIRDWTNGPHLVRTDNGRFLRGSEVWPDADRGSYVAWDAVAGAPVAYDPRTGAYDPAKADLVLFGEVEVTAREGPVRCRPAFQLVADTCARYGPAVAEAISGVGAGQIERAARMLWESRPVAFYAWSGVEQHGNATQTVRAIGQLYALTGCFDERGGNVLFSGAPAHDIAGAELLPSAQRAKALGLLERPLGPSRWELVTSDELYSAALDSHPYRVRGLVGFGANLLMAHADSQRGREALTSLDFYVHADLFMNPTAELADIVLPVASPFETEALRLGFEVSQEAESLIQLRQPLVEPRGEARSDMEIIFGMATRLGLGHHFWDGDIEAGYRYQLEPTGVSLEELRADPAGVLLPLETRYRKFAELDGGVARGFHTPSRKVELYSETLLEHGYPPVPEFTEPALSPRSRPDLGRRYPLVLTCAKSTWYCETQHRGVPSLRRRAPDPEVELHPDTARARGIEAGDWVRIETPDGSVRARARLNDSLDPTVVCGQHGWWQACEEIGAPGYDPFGPEGANLNLVIRHRPGDPMSGSAPHRSYICDVSASTS
ncbi:MAG: molybdopterin-dependent oxidoreductase [Gemmatimonadetes bacterium]|nr:molybdopterin-dependent oxidoreductase [Gemmatimonadota bacterium]NIT89823.1 molybdopterin-dependent oxidoreductase [Gemmatimonadota bacterium]NIU80581.1 molybdopterin-dependent oxidoreductase [Gammaproteobacteria bacterium]NIY13337.1 molybdopterin-dependent oxidoreductase [Gemmatimonadota bacterium]NIY41530.1 molybdopterin-dependent oxidoreductase [Gemmatimonadota bacterium]